MKQEFHGSLGVMVWGRENGRGARGNRSFQRNGYIACRKTRQVSLVPVQPADSKLFMKNYLQQDLLTTTAAPSPGTYTHVAQLMILFGFAAYLSYSNAPTSLQFHTV